MSLICEKCRRLVRDNSIFIGKEEYFCSKCNRTYILSKKFINNYFHRYESPKKSEIIIDKTEETFSIKIPNGNEITHIVPFILFFLFFVYFTYLLFSIDFLILGVLSSIFNVNYLLFLLFTVHGDSVLMLNKKEIIIKRNLFGISKIKKKSMKDFHSVFIFTVFDKFNGIKIDFGNMLGGIGFGMDLSEEEHKWLEKEIRYMCKQLKN